MTWAEFHDLFMGKYFSDTTRHMKAREFLELKQGTMIVIEYVARFTELAHFADDYVATGMAEVRRFENGLKLSIQGRAGNEPSYSDSAQARLEKSSARAQLVS